MRISDWSSDVCSSDLAVTEIGLIYHRHCQAIIAEAEAAQAIIDNVQTEPAGLVRVSCPVLLSRIVLSRIVPEFLAAYPRVRLMVDATNRRVDVIEEGFDLAIRVRPVPLEDSGLVIRSFGHDRTVLVASPKLLDEQGDRKSTRLNSSH